jgi:hypothetical protein
MFELDWETCGDMSTQRLHFDLQLATRLIHERALSHRDDPKLRR